MSIKPQRVVCPLSKAWSQEVEERIYAMAMPAIKILFKVIACHGHLLATPSLCWGNKIEEHTVLGETGMQNSVNDHKCQYWESEPPESPTAFDFNCCGGTLAWCMVIQHCFVAPIFFRCIALV